MATINDTHWACTWWQWGKKNSLFTGSNQPDSGRGGHLLWLVGGNGRKVKQYSWVSCLRWFAVTVYTSCVSVRYSTYGSATDRCSSRQPRLKLQLLHRQPLSQETFLVQAASEGLHLQLVSAETRTTLTVELKVETVMMGKNSNF